MYDTKNYSESVITYSDEKKDSLFESEHHVSSYVLIHTNKLTSVSHDADNTFSQTKLGPVLGVRTTVVSTMLFHLQILSLSFCNKLL